MDQKSILGTTATAAARSPIARALATASALAAVSIAAGATTLGATASPRACRCAQIAIERYFENADIVLVGRADRVERVQPTGGTARLEVGFTPQFRPTPFKGAMDGITFATPIGTASCGVDVQLGESYIVFATVGDADDPRRAWFDSCSGSRLYAGGARASEIESFVGLPANRIVPRLFELADSTLALSQRPGSEFHTSPACWSEARIVHQGTPPEMLRDSLRVLWVSDPAPDSGGVASPNRAYRSWPGYVPDGEPHAGGFVVVEVERPQRLRIAAPGSRSAPAVEWINEKLLFVRIIWGRVQFTDVIVDVERGEVVYEEAARYAAEAFQQYRQACIGQCPCFAVAGSATEQTEPPLSRPANGDTTGLAALTTSLAYLDADWDGRVFTEPGGRAYTISELRGSLGREEYPADVLEIREVDGGWWLRVALYAVSTCNDPDAVPVHAGWVPAYSIEGQPVASTWPRGC